MPGPLWTLSSMSILEACISHFSLSDSDTGDVDESAERVCLTLLLKIWLNISSSLSGLSVGVLDEGFGGSVSSTWRSRGTEFGSPNAMMLSGREGLQERERVVDHWQAQNHSGLHLSVGIKSVLQSIYSQ